MKMSDEFKKGMLQAAEMARVKAAAMIADDNYEQAAVLKEFARDLYEWIATDGYEKEGP